jgi:hypothetical protein
MEYASAPAFPQMHAYALHSHVPQGLPLKAPTCEPMQPLLCAFFLLHSSYLLHCSTTSHPSDMVDSQSTSDPGTPVHAMSAYPAFFPASHPASYATQMLSPPGSYVPHSPVGFGMPMAPWATGQVMLPSHEPVPGVLLCRLSAPTSFTTTAL